MSSHRSSYLEGQSSLCFDEHRNGPLRFAYDCCNPRGRTFFKPCLELTQGHERCFSGAVVQSYDCCVTTCRQACGLPVELECILIKLQAGIPRCLDIERVAFSSCLTGRRSEEHTSELQSRLHL